MSLTIRRAAEADRSGAVELLAAQLVEHHLAADREAIARAVDLALAPHSPAWLLLALRGGQPLGVLLANQEVSVECPPSTLWIEELYVIPSARRTGVARALLAFVCEEARSRGVRALNLEVVPTQEAAFALYRRLGFTDVNRARLRLEL
jgi:ribosomal protein S18 acetylase RimI-like enzyme